MAKQWKLNGFFDSAKLTGLYEAALRRESIRLFSAAPTTEQWNALLRAADDYALPGTRIAMGICENSLFQPMMGLLMKFENVQRFAAVITTDTEPQSMVNAGVSGEMLMLHAVELGLGGCWVSGTYKRGQVGLRLADGEKIVALIALGIPQKATTESVRHKRKALDVVCPEYEQMTPAMKEVARYVQIAPSAINLQPWRIGLPTENTLTISVGRPAQRLDLGICLCHALLALGSTPAVFALDDAAQTATIEL